MNKPRIMGIVNVTPDSFSDGGRFFDPQAAIAHGLRLIEEGADILDIGGESTRPNSDPVSIEDEIARVVPVIRELSKTGKMISVDTRNASTMRAAIEAGAHFLNDISALQDKGALEMAVQSGAEICLMHMQGDPKTMQSSPYYADVISDVFTFLKGRIQLCLDAGISQDRIYADVGIGFGKTLEHNLELLRQLEKFNELGVKILLGTSRKNFIGKIAGETPADQRLGGSLATALWGFQKGVDIIRVHDVRETRQALLVWKSLNQAA